MATGAILGCCVICRATGGAEVVACEIKGDRQGNLRALRCPACGHVQLEPPQYDLGFYDQDGQIENVKKFYGTSAETLFRHAEIEAVRRVDRFAGLGIDIHARHEGGRALRAIDVGGGYGLFGARLTQVVTDAEVTVLEPSELRLEMGMAYLADRIKSPVVPSPRRLSLKSGLLDDVFAEQHAGLYDIVTLFHVLEHVPDPVGLLRLAAKIVHPTHGVVCIEVPNLDDDLLQRSRAFANRWFMLEHISYFSPSTLLATARRARPDFAAEVHGYQRYGIFNYMHWIMHEAPQGGQPDLFEGTDRWWLESSWRALRESTRCSDAICMVMRPMTD